MAAPIALSTALAVPLAILMAVSIADALGHPGILRLLALDSAAI